MAKANLSEYQIKLTYEQLDTLGVILGDVPFKVAAPLIETIRSQMDEQEKSDANDT